jgi:hypothetical protein
MAQPILHQIEVVLVDIGPQIAELDVDEMLVGDGFRAVIDEKHEGRGEQAEADEAKQESDHGVSAGRGPAFMQPLPRRAGLFNPPPVRPFPRHSVAMARGYCGLAPLSTGRRVR